jgi:hypothetical protein
MPFSRFTGPVTSPPGPFSHIATVGPECKAEGMAVLTCVGGRLPRT